MDFHGRMAGAGTRACASHRADAKPYVWVRTVLLAVAFILLGYWSPSASANVPLVAAHPPLSEEQALANCRAWQATLYPPNPVTGEHGDCILGQQEVATHTNYYHAVSPGGAWYDGIYFPYAEVTDGPNLGDAGGCNGGIGGGGKCPKNAGAPMAGDPINSATGNKTTEETDNATEPALTFRRFYNSARGVVAGSMGAHWRHTFDRTLQKAVVPGFPTFDGTFTATRPDGKFEIFTKGPDAVWVKGADNPDTLTDVIVNGNVTEYTLRVAALRITEHYSPDGLLQSIVDDAGQVTSLDYSTGASDTAPAAGLLMKVTAPNGRRLAFAYDGSSRLIRITLPDDGNLVYSYDDTGNLSAVQYPDSHSVSYVYNETGLTGGADLTNALTGIIDEAGNRYENTTYDSSGRATSTGFAGGANLVRVNYLDDTASEITYPLGSVSQQYYVKVQGHALAQGLNHPCGGCGDAFQSRTYDTRSYPARYTDFLGVVTTTTYDADGLLTKKIEAQGKDEERTTDTVWNSQLRVPLLRTVKDASGNLIQTEGWAYNNAGKLTAQCLIDSNQAPSYQCSAGGLAPAGVRRSVMSYCTTVDAITCPLVGLLLKSDGPRNDVSDTVAYAYYLTTDESGCATAGGACHHQGDLASATDGMGLTTTYIAYDKAGRVTRIKDSSGTLVDYAYTPRGWLSSKTIRANASGAPSPADAVTTISYDPTGTVHAVKDADGVTTTYTYDAAHRLTDITDASGARVHYTLDAAGNRTAEQTLSASGTVVRSQGRTFNSLGQLTTLTDGLNRIAFTATFTDSYDANGNLVHSQDGLGVQQKQIYDGLNRLVSTLRDYQGANASTANTQSVTVFDALDRVRGFSDPDGLNTTYDIDALGNARGTQSPDTGLATRSFDIAGNAVTSVDALGTTRTITYDADNRPLAVTFTDTSENYSYKYDEPDSVTGCTGGHGAGRLTRVVEASGGITWCYDGHGNVMKKVQVIAGVSRVTSYVWTSGDRLKSLTTPNGTTITYTRNTLGQIAGVTATPQGGVANVVVSQATYQPFGPVASVTWGNGLTATYTYDPTGALTDITGGAFTQHLRRDVSGNIVALGDSAGVPVATETYGYDPLYRLATVNAASGSAIEAYTYNQTGDRLSKAAPGMLTGSYTYAPGTHHLIGVGTTSRIVDARGNTTANTMASGAYVYGYNDRNRMTSVQRDGATQATYSVNALGLRVQKTVGAQATLFDYNEDSQLISEATGGSQRDYVWLDGMPVGVVDSNGVSSSVAFVAADGLGTPRAVTNSSGSVLWKWSFAGNPFGEAAPTSTTGYALNLRYLGQYFDSESGLSYNINRDYEAAAGRYIQSDPLGMLGGETTFSYAGASPLMWADPLGLYCLKEWQIRGIAGAAVGGVVGALAGSETGPGAAASAAAGALLNGGAGVVDGLFSGEGTGAFTGSVSSMAGAASKGEFVGGVPGAAIGGALASNLEEQGYPRPVANMTGATAGASLGSVVVGYMRGVSVKGMMSGAMKGGAVGLGAAAVQSGLEAAIRAGNHCICGK